MREHAEEVSACAKRFLDERGVAAEYRVVGSGSAAHGLDDVAEAEHASMIVVGSERRGARRRISPGSTGERLLHGAICPVAVAPRGFRERPADAPIAAHRRGLRRHAGGARGAAASRRSWPQRDRRVADALHRGRARARSLLAGRSAATPRRRSWPTVREDVRAALDKALASLPEGVEAAEELLEGDTVDALAALDEHEIDLLVCGSRGYGPVRRVLLGGVLRKLIRRAACPVVVVPRGAA